MVRMRGVVAMFQEQEGYTLNEGMRSVSPADSFSPTPRQKALNSLQFFQSILEDFSASRTSANEERMSHDDLSLLMAIARYVDQRLGLPCRSLGGLYGPADLEVVSCGTGGRCSGWIGEF
jgi:hypothetical protein